MNDIQRATVFRRARQEHLGFLARLLWHLAEDRAMFAEAMHCALFGLWRGVDRLSAGNARRLLYRVALSANSEAWQRRLRGDPRGAADDVRPPSRTDVRMPRALRRALAELPVERSEPLVMRYIEGRPWDQVAASLERSWPGLRRQVDETVTEIRRRVGTVQPSAA